MINERKSGVLCHITSLPGEYGSGDIGVHAHYFIDYLKSCGQTYWQILPLIHPGVSASPYQSLSAFAGNPYLISIDDLYSNGLIPQEYLADLPNFDPHKIDYSTFYPWKLNILKAAVDKFIVLGMDKEVEFLAFLKDNKFWLEDYALFLSLKDKFNGKPWNKWDKPYATRDKATIKAAEKELSKEILEYKIIQFFFFLQWKRLKIYAEEKGIKIIGDLPIYIDFDSDSVWANPELFLLDKNNNPTYVAGVPPDYFCEDGQYWGNPLYDWKAIKADSYDWWIKRLKLTFEMVDIVRIDHFRAFAEGWKVKRNPEHSAKIGVWLPGPGKEFFDVVTKKIKGASIIAEDLGNIGESVVKLRDECGLPGMCVLQFAFDSKDSLFLPHNHVRNQVVYAGTHDNDTIIGWWNSRSEENKEFIKKYLSIDGNDINWQLMKVAAASVANTAIYTIQDILGLGNEYRMNLPGTPNNNWSFRFSWDQTNNNQVDRLKEITELYQRD